MLKNQIKKKIIKNKAEKKVKNEISKKHGVTLDYSKITNYIYLGSNFCCQTHFIPELKKIGITADISLEAERLDQPLGVDYFLWLPTEDQTPIKPKQLLLGANFINNLVTEKIKVYVHCQYGHGRSPMLVMAYLIAHAGLSLTEAVDLVKAKRPEIHLNPKQLKALRHFAHKFS